MREKTLELEEHINELLADPQYQGHPLRTALAQLYQSQQNQLAQFERLTSISDGYQTILNTRYKTLTERHGKQMRQLQKIIKISDHYQHILQDLNESLKIASTQDPLTGLFNRRLMLDRLQNEAALTKRRHNVFSVLMMDIDHFKKVNDTWGHHAGDNALRLIASALKMALRSSDICARWGGEEFLVLLPDTGADGGQEIANRLLIAIRGLRIPEMALDQNLTISIGLAQHQGDDDLGETLQRADRALYAAKAQGRDGIVRASYSSCSTESSISDSGADATLQKSAKEKSRLEGGVSPTVGGSTL